MANGKHPVYDASVVKFVASTTDGPVTRVGTRSGRGYSFHVTDMGGGSPIDVLAGSLVAWLSTEHVWGLEVLANLAPPNLDEMSENAEAFTFNHAQTGLPCIGWKGDNVWFWTYRNYGDTPRPLPHEGDRVWNVVDKDSVVWLVQEED